MKYISAFLFWAGFTAAVVFFLKEQNYGMLALSVCIYYGFCVVGRKKED